MSYRSDLHLLVLELEADNKLLREALSHVTRQVMSVQMDGNHTIVHMVQGPLHIHKVNVDCPICTAKKEK